MKVLGGVIHEDDDRLARRGRRLGTVVIVVAVAALLMSGVIGWVAYRRQESFGTIWADKAPPKIGRCGREWLNDGTGEDPAPATLNGLVQIDSTPGGAPVLALQSGCPDPIYTVMWVSLGPNRFVSYSLSGGP